MKSFLSEYGFAILSTIVVILIIMMISPVGNSVKEALKGTVIKFSGSAENGLDGIDTDSLFNSRNNYEFDGNYYKGDLFKDDSDDYLFYISDITDDTVCTIGSPNYETLDIQISNNISSYCESRDEFDHFVDSLTFVRHNYRPTNNAEIVPVELRDKDLIFAGDSYSWFRIIDGQYYIYYVSIHDTESLEGTVDLDPYEASADEIEEAAFEPFMKVVARNWNPLNFDEAFPEFAVGQEVYLKNSYENFYVSKICGEKVFLSHFPVHEEPESEAYGGFIQNVYAYASTQPEISCDMEGMPISAFSYNIGKSRFEVDPTAFDIIFKPLNQDFSTVRVQFNASKRYYEYNSIHVHFTLLDGKLSGYESNTKYE